MLNSLALMVFVDIVDAGNLSVAARKLKMTRANVSYHLMQLEKSVGLELVRRTTRRLEPTEAGIRLYEHGRTIASEMLAASETMKTFATELVGRVGLSVPSGYGQMVMSEWLIEFKRRYPRIVLEVLFENRVDDLIRDNIDIAVRILPEPPPQLIARELGVVRYIACAARAYVEAHGLPEELEALRNAPLITAAVVGRQLRLRAYRDTERVEITLEPTIISEHFPFLRSTILAGLGIGLVPDYVVADAIQTGEVATALDRYRLSLFGTHMYVLCRPNRHQTRAVRTCLDFLMQKSPLATSKSTVKSTV